MLLFLYKKVSTNTLEEAQIESVYWAQCSVLFNFRVTESQNCWSKCLCRSPCLTSLHKQDHVELVTQDQIQMASEYLQRRRLHNLPEQSVSVLYHPSSKFIFPIFNWNFLQFTGISSLPPIRYLNTLKRFPWTISFPI